MFQCDQLTYIQMQKTGCTHIAALLADLFDGEQVGKHNAATPDQIRRGGYFLSSIRNPWDWYLSLWSFGVQGEGGLRERLTQRRFPTPGTLAARHPMRYARRVREELSKDTALWRATYDHAENIQSFRRWLKEIHDPSNSRHLGEGYGDTVLPALCGFMTHRYLRLCCQNSKDLQTPSRLSGHVDLVRFEQDNCYIDFFIRQESLEESLIAGVEKVRALTEEEKRKIYAARKTNTSRRSFSVTDYYDEASTELVAQRDRLIIGKFGYSAP